MPNTRRDYMDEDMSSSPDPLNDTPTFHGYGSSRPKSQTRRSTAKSRMSIPMSGSSPKKQTFELDVGDTLSPQKIRVTVEAGESDAEGFYTNYIGGEEESPLTSHAPRDRRRERTFTTTVPVKGLSDTESQPAMTPKKKGRPRKATGTPIPPKKRTRAGTPTRKGTPRRKSFGEPGWEDEQDKTFSVGRSADVPGRKRRAQSRSRKGSQPKSSSPAEANGADEMVSNSTNKKGRGRRKAMNEEDIAHLDQESNSAGSQHDMEDNFVEHNPISSPIESNSYNRRPTSNRIGQEDVLIARFSPGNETPRKPGWSSTKTLDATEQMDADFANRPSLSLEPVRSQHSEEPFADGRGSPSTRSRSVSSNENLQYDGEGGPDNVEDEVDEDDHQDGNGVDQTREFDTIMESEGFSMISMDSLNHSTPWNRTQDHDTSKTPRDRSLLSIQQSTADEDEDVASPEREEKEVRPSPSEKSKAEASSPKDALQNFDVSATKYPQPQAISKLLPDTEFDDSFSTIAPEVFEAASPVKALPKPTFLAATIQNDEYEDSFSALPSAVLEAATPAAKRQATVKSNSSSVKASTQLNVPGSKSGLLSSLAIKSTSPRLLTPEETPSPPCESPMTKASTGGEAQPTGRVDGEQSVNEASTIFSQMLSSPPSRRYTYTAHLRQHRQLYPDATETPSIVFSSPHLPPPVPQPNEQVGCMDGLSESRRPTLSPIAKAGRVLQDALVPSSSSRSRSQSLGSPFKSPSASRNPSSVARDCQLSPLEERREKAFPKLCLTDNFAAFSNMEPQWARSASQEDPFSSATRNHRSPSIEQKEQYTLGLPQQPILADRFSSIRSQIGTVRSENEMSWQGEQEIEIISNQVSNVDNVPENPRSVTPEPVRNSATRQVSTPPRERAWAAERAAVSRQIDSAKDDQVLVINSDDDSRSHESDDEDFGLLLETMGTSSPMSWRKQDVPDEPKDVTEKFRRSKLPSPWRKNSKRLVHSDELSYISSPVIEKRPNIAGNIIGDVVAKPLTARRTMTSQFNNNIEKDVDLSGFEIPQKTNFKPRVHEKGGLDLAAIFAASPPKKLPVLPPSSGGIYSQPTRQPTRGTSYDSQPSQRARPETPEESSSPVDGRSFTPIPQKTGFTPRPRSRGADNPPSNLFDINTIKFGTLPQDAQPLNSFPQSRTNLPVSSTPASDPPSSPDYMNDGHSSITSTSEKENQKADDRTLKWAENVNLANPLRPAPHLSPTKSILRSPLKVPVPRPAQDSPSKAVAWVSSSPTPSSPLYRPLSATTWTRDHWLLLEQIVWSWKPENRNSGREDVYGSVRRRHDTRVVSRLVGRSVSSGGRSMVLQQWHLEAVDEFRKKVPGWEEKGVATRVFSLIVAEENRRAKCIVEESLGGGRSAEV